MMSLSADSATDERSSEQERKARNHRLIQQGLLIDFAGLQNVDRGELLATKKIKEGYSNASAETAVFSSVMG